MKKYIKPRYILLPVLLFILVYRQGPIFFQNFQERGETLEQKTVYHLKDQESFSFPPLNEKAIVIFWVSWCGPCKLEMNRIQRAITQEKIQTSQIYAINPFEDREEIKDFISQNSYDFQFIEDMGLIANQINVQGTPTIMHLENQEIRYLHTGVSPISVWRVRFFLN